MMEWGEAITLSLLAGIAIPIGGAVAAVERIQPRWLEQEFRHAVIAFGGGTLLAAVALVLIPEGIRALSTMGSSIAFASGGVVFLLFDRAITKHGGNASQLMAMLLDFTPEAAALGATFAGSAGATGMLLALLIALQNVPEGFNAYRELRGGGSFSHKTILSLFCALAVLGPVCAWIGMQVFARHGDLLGGVMVFCSGGILYLTFQDIAPQAKLERHWGPPLGAVGGFLLGLVGHMLLVK